MYKTLDTNIILLNANNVLLLGEAGKHTIVIPETVVDELDTKKSRMDELGYQAREFGRIITQATNRGVEHFDNLVATILELDDVTIHITASNQYPDFTDTEASILNDRKIIEIALQYDNIYSDTEFVSNDVMCRIRASSLGLKTNDIREVETTAFEFVKTLLVPADTFSILNNSYITEVDPAYKPENYNYKFVHQDTQQMRLGVINSSGIIKTIGKVTEEELRRQDVTPVNADQLFLSHAIQDPTTDIIVAEAAAGTGKTVSAISNAMRLIKQNNPYESILYIRASIDDVDKAEEVGFLAGNDEKFAVYLHPLEDTLDFIARNRHKSSKLKGPEYELFIAETIEKLKEQYNIHALTGLGMRGRTFSNSIVIIDEVQGQSKASLQKMMTRFGKNCKIIVIGSNKQIDSPYVTKFNNGLSVVLNEASKHQEIINIRAVSLSKIVRSPLSEWAETVFSK